MNLAEILQAALDPRHQSEAYAKLNAISANSDVQQQREYTVSLVQLAFSNPGREHGGDDFTHMAMVFLRKALTKNWSIISHPDRQTFWQLAIKRITETSHPPTTSALAHLIATMTHLDPDTFAKPLLHTLSNDFIQATDPLLRKSGHVILAALTQTELLGKSLPAATVFNLLCRGLEDTESSEVVSSALDGLAHWFGQGLGSTQKGGELITRLISTLKLAGEAGMTDIVSGCLSVLNEIAENCEQDEILRRAVLAVTETVIEAAVGLPEGVSDQGLVLIDVVAERHPGVFENDLVLGQVISALIKWMLRCEIEQSSTSTNEDIQTFDKVCGTIDGLCLNVPGRQVLAVILEVLSPIVRNFDNCSVAERRTVCAVLGVAAEGCANALKASSGGLDFLEVALRGLSDSSSVVRQAAVIALAEMAQHLSNVGPKAISGCLQLLLSPSPQEDLDRICLSLQSMLPACSPPPPSDVFDALIHRLLALLSSSPASALAALAGAVGCDRKAFEPYRDFVANAVRHLLESAPPHGSAPSCHPIIVQCRAIEVATQLVRPDRAAQPDFEAGMCDCVYKVLQSTVAKADDGAEDLRAACFRFFSVAVFCAGTPPALVPALVACCMAAVLADDNADPFTEEDQGLGGEVASPREDCVDALNCLVALVASQPEIMAGYASKIAQLLETINDLFYFDDRVIKASASLGLSLLLAVHHTNPPPGYDPRLHAATFDWETRSWNHSLVRLTPSSGADSNQFSPLWTVQTEELWKSSIWPIWATILTQHNDETVVGDLCAALTDAIRSFGYSLLAPATSDSPLQYIEAGLKSIFDGSHPALYPEAFTKTHDLRQADEELFEASSDLIGAVTEALTPVDPATAASFFHSFLPLLNSMINHPSSYTARCNALGCLADAVTAGIKFQTLPALATCPAAISQTVSPHLRRNAAFFSAVCLRSAPSFDEVDSSHLYVAIYQATISAVATPPTDQDFAAAADNLIALMAGFILHLPASILKFTSELQILPANPPYVTYETLIQILCSNLPLVNDVRENIPCAKALIEVVRTRSGFVKANFSLMARGILGLLSTKEAADVLQMTRAPPIPDRNLKSELHCACIKLMNTLNEGETNGNQVSIALRNHPVIKQLLGPGSSLSPTMQLYLNSFFSA